MRILLIEDDIGVADYTARGLVNAGHEVAVCDHGTRGLEMAHARAHDLLIVDRMLPGLDGMELVRSLRSAHINTPVLILSALSRVDQRVAGLEAGGDDYLIKPFALEELLARVHALHRRLTDAEPAALLTVADLSLDRLTRRVQRNGICIGLQPREFRLLEYLMLNADRVVTRTMLLEKVWDYHFHPQTNVIGVHISRLRQKIDGAGPRPLIHTVRGAGYMLSARETPP